MTTYSYFDTSMEEYRFPKSLTGNIISQLNNLRKKNILTDVEIRVGNEKFNAHKLMLVAASGYFEAIIMRQKTDDKLILQVNDIKPEIFKLYLDFIYGEAVLIEDWRLAVELFTYLEFTNTYWPNKDRDVISAVGIPKGQYLEYLTKLDILYPNGIPSTVIGESALHFRDIRESKNINVEVLALLASSGYFSKSKIYDHLVSDPEKVKQIKSELQTIEGQYEAEMFKKYGPKYDTSGVRRW